MRSRLAVAVHPFAVADALADLERRILGVLDPPLNLDGMPTTPLRAALARLRRELTLGDLPPPPRPEVRAPRSS